MPKPRPITPETLKRAVAFYESTKTADEPLGNITAAAVKMRVAQSTMSGYLRLAGVHKKSLSKDQCLEKLKAWVASNGREPKRDEFCRTPLGTHWKGYWSNWQAFTGDAGLTGTAPNAVGPMPDRERLRYKDEITALRKFIADQARQLNEMEDFRSSLFNVVSEPVRSPSWSLPESRPSSDAELPMLYVSDWQYGETISGAKLGVDNAFNPEIANERVRSMVAKTIELSFKHRGKKQYPGIYYLRGGDMISGEIHDELRETNALQSCASARALVTLETWVIKELTKAFGRVHVKSVPGNHGRTTEKPRHKWGVDDNFDVMTHYWLEDVFRGESDKVSFDAPASGDALFQLYGYNFCMTHGDRIGSSGGQGFLGAVATILRGMKKTFDYYATLGTILDYIMVGHFHTSVQLEYGFANGSLPGPSEYAKTFRMRPQAPQQWLLYAHPEFGICDSKALVLGPRPKVAETMQHAFA